MAASGIDQSYGNLKALAAELRKAAIDAYMAERSYDKEEAQGRYINRHLSQIRGEETVTLPDADGYNGGAGGSGGLFTGGKSYSEQFKEITDKIDSTLKRWFGVPDPAGFDTPISDYKKAIGKMSLSGCGIQLQGGDVALPNGAEAGTIGPNMDALGKSSGIMAGKAMTAFKNQFTVTMPRVVKNLYLAMNVHLAYLIAEKNLMDQAREKITNIVVGAIEVFTQLANKNKGISKELAMDLGGVALGLASAPFSGGASLSLAVSGGTAALSTIKVVEDEVKRREEKSRNIGAADYKTAMNNFVLAADGLNANLKESEEKIYDQIQSNTSVIWSDAKSKTYDTANFHVLPAPINDLTGQEGDLVLGKDLAVSRSEVDLITLKSDQGGYMPKIYDEVVSAANSISGLTMATAARREHATLGRGATGPSFRFGEMKDAIYELLLDLSWRIEVGIVNLRAAMDDLEQQDDASSKRIQAIADLSAQGSGVNPWDRSPQSGTNLKQLPQDVDPTTMAQIQELMKPK